MLKIHQNKQQISLYIGNKETNRIEYCTRLRLVNNKSEYQEK